MKSILFFISCLLGQWLMAQNNLKALSQKQLDSLMNVAIAANKYNEAIPYAQTLVAQKDLSDSLQLLYMQKLTGLHQRLGQYAEAKANQLKLVDIVEKKQGKKTKMYGIAMSDLAMIAHSTGDFDQAEPLYLQSLQAYREAQIDTGLSLAMTMSNLGVLYHQTNRFAVAELQYMEAMTIRRVSVGDKALIYASSLNNLGGLYLYMQRYEEAISMFAQCVDIYKLHLPQAEYYYASTLNNLGAAYKNIGNYSKSEQCYQKSIAIRKRILGEKHPDYLSVLNNYAALQSAIKNYDRSIAILTEVVDISVNVFGKKHQDYVTALYNLSGGYKEKGNYQQSLLICEEVLTLQADISSQQSPEYLETLNEIGFLYRKTSNYAQSEAKYQEALRLNRIQTSPLSGSCDSFYQDDLAISTLQGLYYLTKDLYAQSNDKNKLSEGYEYLKTALCISERIRRNFSTEAEKLRTLSQTSLLAANAIAVALQIGSDAQIQEAFAYAEQNKSILLADATKAERARHLGDLPEALAKRELQLQTDLDKLKRQAADVSQSANKAELNNQLNKLYLDINQFKKDIETKYPKYYKLKYDNISAQTQDIQQKLDDRTLFLEYFQADSLIYLFAISAKKINTYILPINKAELSLHIEKMRQALSDYDFITNKRAEAYQLFTQNAYWCYQNLLAQALISDHKIERLIIVCDGELGHLPFETFLTAAPTSATPDYSDLPYLLLKYKISYNYSATLWKENLNTTNSLSNTKMLAMAAHYGGNTDSFPAQRNRSLRNTRLTLRALPAAEAEVQRLSTQHKGVFLQNKAANESFFKAHAHDYNIIHLAMHGLLDADNPMLSALVFSENSDSIEDNFLEAWEVAHLKLQAQLVVLSACETGYGKFKQGEGVISLARAFMYAGAPAVVVSLWQVNDQATAQLMVDFYQQLATGIPKDEALQQVKINYLHSAEGVAAHPAFWAAFIQLGDTRPVFISQSPAYFWYYLLPIVFLAAAVFYFLRRPSTK
jgi:CHAT domain-containing protein/tetratricopeptide (TPR) repeat protein